MAASISSSPSLFTVAASALGMALLSGTELFSFLAVFDGVVFGLESDLLVPALWVSLGLSLAFAALVARWVIQAEHGRAAGVA